MIDYNKVETFEEFEKRYEKIKEISVSDKINDVINEYYKRYLDMCFDTWLSKFTAEEINNLGVKAYRKKFEDENNIKQSFRLVH